MSPLVDAAMRISVVLAVGLVTHAAVRHRSPALRHLLLAVALVAAPMVLPLTALLPPVAVALPAILDRAPTADAPPVGSAVADTSSTALPSAAAGTGRDAGATWTRVAVTLWAAGGAVGLVSLVSGLWRLRRLTARGRPLASGPWRDGLDAMRAAGLAPAALTLRAVAAPDLLATWGWRRPVVLVPEAALAWPADRIHVALRHELAHVARADWAVQLYADTLRALLWWNPLMWRATRCLRQDSELACDDAVLASGVVPHAYADQLVAIARACRRGPSRWAAATPMAHPSTLQKRIVAMLNPRLDRSRPTRRTTLLAIAALLVAVVLPAAMLRAAQGGPQTLEGAIYDPTGAVLPGVEVTLTARTTRLSSVTDAAGQFRFDAVAPGEYVFETALAGFKKLREPVTLASNGDWNRAVTLQVGDLQETINVRERRVGPPPPPAPGPTPVRVGGNIRAPRKTLNTAPVYPPSMVEAGREGIVPIEATIGLDGRVTMVRVVSAQVHPDFAIAAVEAVRQWQYAPTLLNGRPVQVVMTVQVAFTLE